ncbi:phage portal protein family protein [Morganella morganii]|uniref:phage portal protein family protein n=1 Tax=Morganella morganii TaxID=582 RepID=UPI002685722F
MVERDGHIFAEMEKRKNVLLTLDWSVEPPKNATAQERDMKQKSRSGLMPCRALRYHSHGMEAVGHGFSCQEIEWELIEKVWLPKALNLRPHYWFVHCRKNGTRFASMMISLRFPVVAVRLAGA